jgi:hypothetical protein
MAQLTLDQTDIDRIEEVRRQFDPAEHLATADLFEGLESEEKEAALKFMREMIRDELYGGLIQRAALEAMVDHNACSPRSAKQSLDEAWNYRYGPDPEHRRRIRESHWGHNLTYISNDWFHFARDVRDEHKDALLKAVWTLMDLAVVAMFGPIGDNDDEPALEEV